MMNIIFGEIKELSLPKESQPKTSRGSKHSIDVHALFSLYILHPELEKIEEHLRENPKIESGGLLIGHAFNDKDDSEKIFTVIVGSVPVKSVSSSVGHYTVSPEELSRARLKIPEGLMSVGWYHSHPGHGIFLSGADMGIMKTIYNLDWQIAFVFDTFSGDKGFFHGKNGDKITSVYYLEKKPAIIEAVIRYNCAVSAKEGGDEYLMESFKNWLRNNPMSELSHWVRSGLYQDVQLNSTVYSSGYDLEWQKEFNKAVVYYKSGKLQSAQFVFEQLAEIRYDPTVLEYLSKITDEQDNRYKKLERISLI